MALQSMSATFFTWLSGAPASIDALRVGQDRRVVLIVRDGGSHGHERGREAVRGVDGNHRTAQHASTRLGVSRGDSRESLLGQRRPPIGSLISREPDKKKS